MLLRVSAVVGCIVYQRRVLMGPQASFRSALPQRMPGHLLGLPQQGAIGQVVQNNRYLFFMVLEAESPNSRVGRALLSSWHCRESLGLLGV